MATAIRKAEDSAVHAHAAGLAALMRSYTSTPSHGINLRAGVAVDEYCDRHGWPYGTVDHPLCDSFTKTDTPDDFARFERELRDSARSSLIPDARTISAQRVTIVRECQARGWLRIVPATVPSTPANASTTTVWPLGGPLPTTRP
jgi:hypothetical protein